MKAIFRFIYIITLVAIFGCSTNIEGPGIYSSIVINEVLPKNSRFGSDENGKFNDWIELYNLSGQDIDLTGCYLTDSKKDLAKWKFPDGTKIPKNGFLIVWANGDSNSTGLHTNYKLSAEGENIVLVTPDQEIIDMVEYPATTIEQSYARIPNGTGNFTWTTPTFNKSNE
jgi:hypothetical protein